ncbi:outer membrane transport energization protein ExbB (TC 2.C.1.1.1) [Lampropedia hyalina DSM 16112]|jgi:biopolymer transport protein ExbB|uniref:Biopolymer transport protein ExbB n=1 Tax=Lampropedia hyalina DSM 16112 TaxID=1122156 RepID=A0A1M4XGM3_9BURK|nr:MotA/TolQ/ExbB proton channel family protein [Lampropedia hyalina]SHE92541.1 outer membrane transport energization protein ExbB (TC 2.C.1.1.1) [Lampropedia hyalina DSM 16112]
MGSEFGILGAWNQADSIGRTVAILLLLMSIATWIVIIIKTLSLMRYKRMVKPSKDFWHSESLESGIQKLGHSADNPFLLLTLEGREAVAHHRNTQEHLHDSLDISDWITRNLRYRIDGFTARLQSGLSILATVGSIAPFVGLFGTVWGIIHALLAIGASGQASMDTVAGPIGEALVMTAAGLAVAIPAVVGYNALIRGNKSLLLHVNSFAHDLHAYYVTGARVSHNAKPSKELPQKKG